MPTHDLTTNHYPIGDLRPHPDNPRNGDTDAISESLRVNGQYRPIVVARGGVILAGNHTYMAAMELGWETIDGVALDVDPESPEALRIMLADNRTADRAWYDDGLLLGLLESLDSLDGTGYVPGDVDALFTKLDKTPPPASNPSLAERFVVPPLSVLRQASGPWQERKRHWLDSHLRSHLGRGTELVFSGPQRADSAFYAKKLLRERRLGRALTTAEFVPMWEAERDPMTSATSGTSTFDPVLAELVYRWFGRPGGTVLDPCAGGSVRGLVASVCGMAYTGVDISAEQIQANEAQVSEWDQDPAPTWIVGDSTQPEQYPAGPFDLLFTCPPYHDLERYSDDPADLSNMTWPDFRVAHHTIIRHSLGALADDRFAVWVISDVRGPGGVYRGLVADTIAAFAAEGAHLYNDMILVETVGSLAQMAGRQFTLGRKAGRTHQHVLVFVKGNPKAAHKALGPVPELAMAEVEPDVDDAGIPIDVVE